MRVHVPTNQGTRTLARYAGTNRVQFGYAYPFGYVGTRTPYVHRGPYCTHYRPNGHRFGYTLRTP